MVNLSSSEMERCSAHKVKNSKLAKLVKLAKPAKLAKMKTYIIPQTNLLYCERLMNSQEPSVKGEYQGQGQPQFGPARTLKYI